MNTATATIDQYAERRIRRGKTAKDARNGAKSRAAANQAARAAYTGWCKSTESKSAITSQAVAKYPAHLQKGNGNGAARRPERRPSKRAK